MKLLAFTISLVAICGLMSAAPNESGIDGVISMSPSHGGPIRKGESGSAPLANIDFVVKKGDEVVANFTTDEQGAFHVALPPGNYRITRKDAQSGIGHYDQDVQVEAGEMKKVNLTVDTGLR